MEWKQIIDEEREKDYYKKLKVFVDEQYVSQTVYPPRNKIFDAFKLTPYDDVKVVILGQDPYHGENQAHGLAFSVQEGIKVPPSLVNIYKEINGEKRASGNLESWAKQGVLLLNTVLTVEAGKAGSHRNQGWEKFTDEIIKSINKKDTPVVFLLWGKPAQAKASLITNPLHHVLTAPHPSPLSAHTGFFGCNHFKLANDILEQTGQTPINWEI
ncbi:MAG: uracil-DNA glycosylase [Epulopiscium sp. Nele67-Bin004]|nr:MAG: uracil-DNA glycosylase [Epulopiscium sp. Nele67-Bin004]